MQQAHFNSFSFIYNFCNNITPHICPLPAIIMRLHGQGGMPLSRVWTTMPPRSQPKHTEH